MENAILFIVMMYAHVMLRARRSRRGFWPVHGHIYGRSHFLREVLLIQSKQGRIILFLLCY